MISYVEKLPFSPDEYRRRLRRIREMVTELGLDAVLIHSPENFYYVTGYHTLGYSVYQSLLIPLEGQPALITRTFEAEASVRGTSNVKQVIGYGDTESPLEVVRSVLIKNGLEKAVIGVEMSSRNLSPFQYVTLRHLCQSVRWRDCSGIVEAARLVKSSAELAYIRQSAKAVAAAIRAGVEITKVGATENEIAAEVYRMLILRGSEYPGYPPFITSGPRGGLSHSTWANRRLKGGDAVLVEASASIKRYHAPMAWTPVVGKPSRRIAKMAAAVRESLGQAIQVMRPGVASGEVHRAGHEPIERAGFGAYFQRNTGYSVGIAFPPTWSEARTVPHYVGRSPLAAVGADGRRFYLNRNNASRLEPGMVFHVIPGILVPGECNVVTSATVAVTRTGVEVLTEREPDGLANG